MRISFVAKYFNTNQDSARAWPAGVELRLTWRKQHVFNLFMTQQLLILGYLSNSIFIFANFRKLNVKRF